MIKRQGHVNLSGIPPIRNAQDKLICLNCSKLLPKRKKKYCSVDCMEEFYTAHDHQRLRAKLVEKCKWKCQKCGTKLVKEPYQPYRNTPPAYILDHITPIAVGGAEFEESNLQILCGKCNKVKTAWDAKVIAKARGVEKIMIKGQKQLHEVVQ